MSRTFFNPGLDGKYERRYKNGLISDQGFYQNGYMNGKYTCWFTNGDLYFIQFFRDGLADGENKSYFDSGYAIRRFYKNGRTVDNDFSWKKKEIFLNMKRYLYSHIIPDYNSFVIHDLGRLVHSL